MESLIHESNGLHEIPTSLAPLKDDNTKLAAAYRTGDVVIFDLHKSKAEVVFPAKKTNWLTKIVAHPSSSLLFTAGDEKANQIRFLDSNSGECVRNLGAHTSIVSSLTIDSTGETLISSCHESSIRFWNIASGNCMLELSANLTHRKKYGESIHTLAYHPTKPLLASGGADGIVKLYTP